MSSFAAERPRFILEIDVAERLHVDVADDEAGFSLSTAQGGGSDAISLRAVFDFLQRETECDGDVGHISAGGSFSELSDDDFGADSARRQESRSRQRGV